MEVKDGFSLIKTFKSFATDETCSNNLILYKWTVVQLFI